MLGLASKTEPAVAAQRGRAGQRVCLTWSQVRATGGTPKTRAGWAFVSGVSVVSPNLELREDSNEEGKKHGRISWRSAPCAETGETSAAITRVSR